MNESRTASWPELATILAIRLLVLTGFLVLIALILPSDDIAFYTFMAFAFIITIPYSLWLRNKIKMEPKKVYCTKTVLPALEAMLQRRPRSFSTVVGSIASVPSSISVSAELGVCAIGHWQSEDTRDAELRDSALCLSSSDPNTEFIKTLVALTYH